MTCIVGFALHCSVPTVKQLRPIAIHLLSYTTEYMCIYVRMYADVWCISSQLSFSDNYYSERASAVTVSVEFDNVM